MTSYRHVVVLSFALLCAVLVSRAAWTSSPVFATGPCDLVDGPPIGGEEPDIAGTVTNAISLAGISGATMQLYACNGSSPTYVTSTTTDSSGHYLFSDLSSPAWYYIQAQMTGPLAGKSPSGGTSNPSAAMDVQTDVTVNFSFQ